MNRPLPTGQGALRFLFALLSMGCMAVPATHTLAGTTSSSTMGGTAASVCSFPNPDGSVGATSATVTMTVVKNNASQVPTFFPASVTVFCNRPSGATLSVSSSQIIRKGQSTTSDYTLGVNGWTSGTVIYTSAATSPAATTSSIGTPVSKTLTFTATNFSLPANDTYSATITLGVTGN